MHIPDPLLSPAVCAGSAALSGACLLAAGRAARLELAGAAVPLVGVTGAFLFAAQTVNFPVPGGTSGHLLGAALAGCLIGPASGMLTVTVVVVLQALLFSDGGLLALGANVLNMAVAGVAVGAGIQGVARGAGLGRRAELAAAGAGGAVSVLVAAALCAVELAASGTVPARLVVPAMLVAHLPIALVEGVATASILAFVQRVRPDLLATPTAGAGPVVAGLAAAAVALVAGSPWASQAPDGLEGALSRLRITPQAGPLFAVPFPDYLGERGAAMQVAASMIGLVAAFAVGFALARLIAHARPGREPLR
jgi:cobalt/nickel transport system permease protein